VGLDRTELFHCHQGAARARAMGRAGRRAGCLAGCVRYAAGRSRSDALDIAAVLLEQGHGVSIDLFGERVIDAAVADHVPGLRVSDRDRNRAPIILLSHGPGPSNNLSSLNGYAPLANFWTSHGFVVIQPTHLSAAYPGVGRSSGRDHSPGSERHPSPSSCWPTRTYPVASPVSAASRGSQRVERQVDGSDE
jgi:hypothetical protein